jgi:hypothetical protein
MGEKDSFAVVCPCCGAKLTVDPSLCAVISHELPPKTGPARDLDQALGSLRGAAGRREEVFRQSVEAEKGKGKVLDRKFQEGLKKAKDSPDPPLRPIDLD